MTIDRRTLLRGSAAMAAAGALIGPFGARSAAAQAAAPATGAAPAGACLLYTSDAADE